MTGKTIKLKFYKKRNLLYFFLVYMPFLVSAQPVPKIVPSKKIAFTFDACMTTGMLKRIATGADKDLYNSEIIIYLRQEKIPATLFITGLWAEKYPEIVKELAKDPLFEIENHSFSHRSFTDDCFSLPVLPKAQKEIELLKSQEILQKLTGKKPTLFRFPGGCCDTSDVELVNKSGMKVINWNYASGDAFNSDTEAIKNNVIQKAKPGAIVVFHLDGGRYAPKTAEALKLIIPELKKKGYVFSKVTDLR